MLVISSGFWIRGCRAHPAKVGTLFCVFLIRGCRVHFAKVGTLSGSLDMRMRSSTCQSWWYFVWVFGYEDGELLLRKYVLFYLFLYIYMRMQRSSWSFGYEEAELLLFFYMAMQNSSCQSWSFVSKFWT